MFTFLKSINKDNLITWPGIDDTNFSKVVGMTTATAKGHLDQERRNLQSTEVNITQDSEDTFL